MKQKDLEALFLEHETQMNIKASRESNVRANLHTLLNSSASDVDSELIARETEMKVQYEAERKQLIEDYETVISKLSNQLTLTTSQQQTKFQGIVQMIVKIFCLELDKVRGIVDGKQVPDVNGKIAKLIVAVTPDGKCREYFEVFKRKLSTVLLSIKSSLETTNREAIGKRKVLSDKNLLEANIEVSKTHMETLKRRKSIGGKCMVEMEKVISDLQLIKDSLYSVFQGIENLDDTIINELNKEQGEYLEDAANRYRILLNTILRFIVEVTWIMKNKSNSKQIESENEELVRMKLLNSELSDMLVSARQEIEEQHKRLALFVGEHV